MPPPDQVIVSRLRWQGSCQAGADAAATRVRLSRLLGSATVRPPGLPPSTVLIVRRLADPLPERFVRARHAVTADPAWQRAAQEALMRLYQAAARPVIGSVPADSEAVRFADEGELLACLARDICLGLSYQRWWWQTLLRVERTTSSEPGAIDTLVQRMAQRGDLVPAVMAQLQRWGQAVALVQRLSTNQSGSVLRAMLSAYGLPSLPAPARVPTGGNLVDRLEGPPWIAAAWPALLSRERRGLFGLALDLHARPYEIRSTKYQRRLTAWWQGTVQVAPSPARWEAETPGPGPPGTRAVLPGDTGVPAGYRARVTPGAIGHDKTGLGLASQPQVPATQPTTIEAGIGPAAGPRVAAAPWSKEKGSASQVAAAPRFTGESTGPSVLPQLPESLSGGGGDPRLPRSAAHGFIAGTSDVALPAATVAGVPVTRPVEPSDRTSASVDEDSQEAVTYVPGELYSWRDGGESTRLGGVLYLVNLMVALELPACFEEGWRLHSQVGPWGLLEALARELLGDELAGLEADPLWAVLAQLAGRPAGQPPGIRLPRSRPRRWPMFQVPPGWLKGQPEAESVPPALPRARRGQLNAVYRPLLARWLAQALPFITRRLRLALGMGDDASLAKGLLLLPGRLIVSSSHVDLVASLSNISLPVRLAGLDHNPGWLPDFGRVIYLHFE